MSKKNQNNCLHHFKKSVPGDFLFIDPIHCYEATQQTFTLKPKSIFDTIDSLRRISNFSDTGSPVFN